MSSRRKSLTFSRRTLAGAPPGTLTAAKNALPVSIRIIAYSETELVDRLDASVDDIAVLRQQYPLIWVDVTGLGDVEIIQRIGTTFGLHGLALEDVLNVHQRPKVEEFADHLFLIARMVDAGVHTDTEQMAFFLGKDYLLTFQEFPGDCLDPLRERILQSRGRIRQSGADYLCYSVIDSILDGYFPVLESCGERLEHIEDRIVKKPAPKHVRELHNLKRDLLVLRRAIWPHREMLNALIRDGSPFFSDTTRLYLRDAYDHTVQLMDLVETYREIATGLLDVYISSMSAKLNEIMKVLAVVGTVFMPLTFIVGYYGMNFDTKISPWNLPELSWRFGNAFAVFLMICCVAGMLWYFSRKQWIDFSWLRNQSKKTNKPKS